MKCKNQGLQDKQLCVRIKGLASHPRVVVDKSRCFPLQKFVTLSVHRKRMRQ